MRCTKKEPRLLLKVSKATILRFLLSVFFLTGLLFQNSFSSIRFSKDSLKLHDYIEKGSCIAACVVSTAVIGWVLLVMYANAVTIFGSYDRDNFEDRSSYGDCYSYDSFSAKNYRGKIAKAKKKRKDRLKRKIQNVKKTSKPNGETHNSGQSDDYEYDEIQRQIERCQAILRARAGRRNEINNIAKTSPKNKK
jgi:hypothetical protein